MNIVLYRDRFAGIVLGWSIYFGPLSYETFSKVFSTLWLPRTRRACPKMRDRFVAKSLRYKASRTSNSENAPVIMPSTKFPVRCFAQEILSTPIGKYTARHRGGGWAECDPKQSTIQECRSEDL